jgi:hypothetical protein
MLRSSYYDLDSHMVNLLTSGSAHTVDLGPTNWDFDGSGLAGHRVVAWFGGTGLADMPTSGQTALNNFVQGGGNRRSKRKDARGIQ